MTKRKRRPPHARPAKPKPIRLTENDRRILEAIHAFDGMMSLEQIDRLRFNGTGGTWPRERMRALFDHRYVNMPNTANAHRVPAGETIYFLDVEGARVVADLYGESLKEFTWRKQPRMHLISHDLAVNKFRIDVKFSALTAATLKLHQWVPESEFWTDMDVVTYQTRKGKSNTRGIRPDGFFTIRRASPDDPGADEEYAFLLEIDKGTEDNPRFARDKVLPGIAYLSSQVYQERFGVSYGRWLVVTTGEDRLENMREQAERSGGEDLFYFTTFDQVSPESVLTQPIWKPAGTDKAAPMIPNP
ncbi:MAG TPA: replication-relaxation family protein [Dehalococcoidia bacterium]|nr:replication-relaxation family protein [Dehalococcoidia bacterium]